MEHRSDDTKNGLASLYLLDKYSESREYLMVTARVMLIGLEPGGGHYVGVDFVPPPEGGPLGVSTQWDAEGVEMARLALAHGKRLVIVYRKSGFRWADIVDLAVVDF